MQYHLNTAAVNVTAITAAPRVVDSHGLLHMRVPKAAKACDAADVVDGLAILGNPTLKLAAVAYGVSIGSVARALRLTPEQREAVRKGQRPLILPAIPPAPPVPAIPPIPPVITPVVMGPRERLDQIVAEIGLDATLTCSRQRADRGLIVTNSRRRRANAGRRFSDQQEIRP